LVLDLDLAQIVLASDLGESRDDRKVEPAPLVRGDGGFALRLFHRLLV